MKQLAEEAGSVSRSKHIRHLNTQATAEPPANGGPVRDLELRFTSVAYQDERSAWLLNPNHQRFLTGVTPLSLVSFPPHHLPGVHSHTSW